MSPSQEIARMVGFLMVWGFLFIFFAGLYAGFYTAGKMFRKPWLTWIGYVFAVAQFASGMNMVFTDFLDPFWKKLVVFIAVAYLFIPPIMWRIVLAFHNYYEEEASAGHGQAASFGPLN